MQHSTFFHSLLRNQPAHTHLTSTPISVLITNPAEFIISSRQEARAGTERVQNFAARLTTGRWDENPEVLRHDLAWPLLSQRRVFQKLCLARRILTGGSLIPDSFFTPHPLPILRHLNSCPLMQPSVTTNYHRSSFFISVVSRWNSVPDYIVSLSSNLAFKRHLKEFMDV